MTQLILLQFTHLSLFLRLPLLAFFDLLKSWLHSWSGYIFAILQGLLTCVVFFVIFLFRFGNFWLVFIDLLHQRRKFLSQDRITCILSCFFFFQTHSSPPIFAPSPPSLVQSFQVFFLSSDLFKLLVVPFLGSLEFLCRSFSISFSIISLAFLYCSIQAFSSSSR